LLVQIIEAAFFPLAKLATCNGDNKKNLPWNLRSTVCATEKLHTLLLLIAFPINKE